MNFHYWAYETHGFPITPLRHLAILTGIDPASLWVTIRGFTLSYKTIVLFGSGWRYCPFFLRLSSENITFMLIHFLAESRGFEPLILESKSSVLPLHQLSLFICLPISRAISRTTHFLHRTDDCVITHCLGKHTLCVLIKNNIGVRAGIWTQNKMNHNHPPLPLGYPHIYNFFSKFV